MSIFTSRSHTAQIFENYQTEYACREHPCGLPTFSNSDNNNININDSIFFFIISRPRRYWANLVNIYLFITCMPEPAPLDLYDKWN